MVICEYAPKGTLYQFLRNCHISGRQDYLSNGNCSKTSFMLSPSELLTFALQIAKGMQHLALMRVRNITSELLEDQQPRTTLICCLVCTWRFGSKKCLGR
jgi:hypothetical protein